MLIGIRLKDLREERNLLQKDIAKIIGITDNAISNYERGTRIPDTETLSRLADFFGVSIDYILGKTNIKNVNEKMKASQQAEDIYKVDPDMLIQMCRAVNLPKEERDKIKEYSAMLIEKHLRELAEKEKAEKEQ
ncbi:MAG: helix-turn-helix domain-containing protein [Bacillota bacterium]